MIHRTMLGFMTEKWLLENTADMWCVGRFAPWYKIAQRTTYQRPMTLKATLIFGHPIQKSLTFSFPEFA